MEEEKEGEEGEEGEEEKEGEGWLRPLHQRHLGRGKGMSIGIQWSVLENPSQESLWHPRESREIA